MNSRTTTAVVAAIATGMIGIGVGLVIGHDSGAAVAPVQNPATSSPTAGTDPTATPQASTTATPRTSLTATPRTSATPTPRSGAGATPKSTLTPLPIPTDPDTPGQEFMPNWAKQACTATVTGTAYHRSTSESYYEITCQDGYVMGYEKRSGSAPTH